MNDDITVAFDPLEVRAIATRLGDSLDRICVRDFMKDVEIGAFQSERDTVQGLRFNVVLEVVPSTAADSDDVDQVLSYDAITEAIEEELAQERLNLLETLAERIAQNILAHPRARRVFVRIEKTDRIPGTLGVEIERSKKASPNEQGLDAGIDPLVLFMPNDVLHGTGLKPWLDVVAAHVKPAVICLQPITDRIAATDVSLANLHIGLLSIEQNAWVLAAKDARCVVVGSRTELDWAMKNGQLSVWAPSKIVLDAVIRPKEKPNDPLALAQWFAKEFFAGHVTVLGDFKGAEISKRLSLVKKPSDL